MATAIGRRGPDDRRPSVLAPSETGRISGEAALPAHRAGGRIPVGGAGLRSRLAYITAVTTAVAALAFLVPLGWELRTDHRDRALSAAARASATVAGAISAGAGKKGIDAAIAAAGGRPVIHPPGGAGRRSRGRERRATCGRRPATSVTATGRRRPGTPAAGHRRRQDLGGRGLRARTASWATARRRDWWLLLGIALGLVGGSVFVVDRLARGAVSSARNLVAGRAGGRRRRPRAYASSRPARASWPRPGTRSTGWPTAW